MNLPTWSGRADLVALSVRRLPQGYNPAWFGYLIGTHHRASTLAWLIDHGETSVKEIAPETIGPNIRMLREAGLITRTGDHFSAHPQLSRQMAHSTVYQMTDERPERAAEQVKHHLAYAVQVWAVTRLEQAPPVNHRLPREPGTGVLNIDQEGNLTVIAAAQPTEGPSDTATHLNALSRALEAITAAERHDAGFATPIRRGWINANNVR